MQMIFRILLLVVPQQVQGSLNCSINKGMTEDEMVGRHHLLDGHEFEQGSRAGDGQGSLACCSPWGREQSDTTERLN